MKKFLALILSLCLLLCSAVLAEEEEIQYDVVFDSYDVCVDAWLDVVVEDIFEEGVYVEESYGGVSLLGATGETVADVMKQLGYQSIEPASATETFEGWMVYEQKMVEDEFGFEDWVYEKRSEEGVYLSTGEVMNMVVPEYNVMFVAKWADVPEEEYFQPVEEVEVIDLSDFAWPNTFAFSANGGVIRMCENGDWEADFYEYWVENGLTVPDVMTDEKVDDQVYFTVQKEGAEFLGWLVYAGDALEYGYDEPIDEFARCFVHASPYEDGMDMYLMLTNCELYGENLLTEDLWEIVLEGKSYYAIAQWSE